MILNDKQTKISKIICTALLTRYPFWKSISFLLFVADLAQLNSNNAYIVFPDWFVYSIVAIYFISGVLTSHAAFRNQWSFIVICIIQSIVAFTIYTHSAVKYSIWVKMKIITYYIGTIGVFLLLAALVGKSKIFCKFLNSMSNLALFSYFMLLSFLFLNSNLEEKAISNNSFISNVIVKYSILVYSFISMSFFLNKFKLYTSILSIISLIIVNCLFIDSKFNYWSRNNVGFWTQISLLIDNICVIIGLIYVFMFESYKIKFD